MDAGGKAARVLAALIFFIAVLYAAPKAAAAFRNVQEGAEAPPFQLKDIAGGDVSLEGYKKERAVLIVFWATWSGRSLEELRYVQKLFSEYEAKGLKAVAVNVEHEHLTDDDLRAIKGKAAELGLSFPVAVDAGLETFRGYGVAAVPSTALLGEGAVLKAAFNGFASSASLEIRDRVEALLGIKGPERQAAAPAMAGHKPARQALLNYNLGRRLYASGMIEKAEYNIRTAAAADPAWAAPHVLLGDILMAKAKKDPSRAAEARKEFEAAVAAEDESVAARTGLARAHFRMGQAAEAEKAVDEALARGASYPPALLLKAAILGKKGDAAGAAARVQEAVALNPMDPETHAMAGWSCEAAGNLAGAAREYRKAFELKGE